MHCCYPSVVHLLLLALFLVRPLGAFPSGAPTGACNTLLPQHDGTSPEDCGTDCPFSLSLISIDGQQVSSNLNQYRCGAVHTIQLRSSNDAFKGFVVQGRRSTPNFDGSAPYLGAFERGGSDWKLWKCSTPSATHSRGSDKSLVDLTWRAPLNSTADPVTFWYSVVKEFDVFHVKLKGLELTPDPVSCNQGCSASIDGTTLSVACTNSIAVSSAQCTVDGGAPQSCVLPYRSDIRKYSPGLHQVAILANGPNGAQETANAYFTVESSLTASCDSTLSSANILSTTCTASSAIKSATCAIDSETPQTCSFPFITDVSSLSLGDHTVTISITGVNGAAATVREVFNIQGTLPYTRDVSMLSVGSHQIALLLVAENGATSSPTFTFHISDHPLACSSSQTASTVTISCSNSENLSAVKCSIDEEIPATCMLPYKRDTTSLQTGKHTFTISATNGGATQTTTLSFISQAMVSASCIASTNSDNILSVSCRTSNPIRSVQCSVDGEIPESCTLPYTRDVSMLSIKQHQIALTFVAVNGATTTYKSTFQVSAMQSLSCTSSQTSSMLTISCLNSNDLSNVQCYVDEEAASTCALPYIRDITGLQTGRHTVTISAKSVSGGSARSATLSFNTQASVSASCSAVASASNILSVSCTTSSPINSIQCSVDGEAPQSCTLPYTRDVSTLSVGSHQISVSFVAVNGATISSTQAFTVSAVQSLSCSSSQTATQLTVSCANAGDLTNLRCSVDGDTPSVCMLPYTRDISGLQTGKHTVTISATTVSSGSARSATLSFNTQASVSASCSAVASASNILSVSCTTSSPINSIQCSVDGEAPQSCTLLYTRDVSTLSVGSHQISVSFVAVNGATTSSTQAFTVSAVQSLSCSSSQTATQLTVSCSNAGDLTNLRCSLDGDTPSVCMLPYTRDISGLQTGKHTVTISATTVSSGSARSATLSFNTQASVSASCSAVTSASNILSVSCTTSSPINSIQCSVDGEAPQSCTLPYTRDVSTLSVGSHQISVSFVAVNGATTSSTQAFTVSAVQSLSCSSSQTATQLIVSCSNAGDLTNLRCSVDGDTPSVCMLPYTRDISGLQTGKHTVTISATTVSSGSARSATLSFNTQASVSASCSAVTSASNILSVSCTTSSPINSIQCSIDGEAPQSCTLPYTRDVSTLSVGSHQISVSFVAVNGATISSTQAFTVSAVQSLSCSSSQTATQLTVSCSNAGDLTNLRCSLDGDTPSVCMLPYTRDISGLQTGKHTVTISATTVSSGSARSATLSFNTQASVSASCSAVASASNILSVSCTTSSPINSIQCSVDGEAPQSCTLPYTRDVSTLSVGSHQISVSFVAVNGATTSSTQAFTVSAVQSLSCSSSQTATQLTVSCSNAGDLTNLRCSVDGDTSSVCMLPYTRDISGLQTGKHTVTISATTVSSGSARSATLSFNTQASVSASCSAVTSASNILSVSCTTSSPINSIQCSVDGEAPQSCTLPYTRDVSTLSVGSHQISVSFVAVNGATTSSTQAFTVSAVQSLSCSSSQTATQLIVSCSNAGDLTNLRCSVDGDTPSVCMLPYTRDISGLQTGKHTVTISATTVSSGSARSATLSFNTQASVSASCSAVTSASNILSVSCTTSSPINSIQCSIDGEAPQSCTLPYTRDVSTLSVGSHQISVSFVAVNGATISSTQAFTVSAVQSLSCSSSQTATQLTVSCSNAGDLTNLRCSLDGDTPSVCMLPYTRDISGLQTGKHTVTISATTVSSGPARSATLSFNTQASVSASCSAVASASNILSVSCTTSSPINSIQCSVDGEAPQSCTLPYTRDVSTLSVGSHQTSVSFVAVNGATTSSTQAFTVSAVQSLSCSSSQTATQLTVSCSNAGDLTNLRCSLDGDTPSVCMLPYTRDISGLQTGKHTVTISATTVSSGSARSATLSFNTQASVSASCSAVTSASNILSVSCTTSSPINSIQCSVDGEAPQSCTLPYTRDVSTLSVGSHQISVSFVAVNGATTSSTQAFTVSAVQSLSCSSSQTATQLTVSCSNAGDLTNLRCSLDGDTPSVCMLPYTRDISGLQTGKHTVTISATTVSSGSARSATLSFNTQASVSASCSAVTSASNILSVSCTTSSPINSIQCSVDGEAPQSCTLPYTRDVSTLSAGSHQISVSFVAVNGATTSSSQAFTVSAVQSLSCSSSQTATQLTVSCSNAGDLTNLRCSVDGDTSSVCMLPYTRDISGLQTGKHTVTISATTVSSGSARSATLSFNTQASVSASCSAVASASNILSVSCTTSSPINSIQCSVDGEAPQSCTLPYTRDVSTLSVGSHQISVSFVAVNGATTSSTQAFTVSAVQFLSCSSSQTATQLTVSCANAGDLTNLRCSLDGDTPSVCMLPYTRDISGLQTGKHTVTISATTVSSGSARSATLSFNTQASVSASCSAVASASNILSVSCTTSSPINSIQCSVDGEAPQSCTLPYTRDVSTLSVGSHQISVSFVAVNGATTSSTQAFTVSAVQSLSCSSSQTATQLTVSCSNAGDLTNLRCSLDGDTPSVCMLPYTRDISGLQTGKHTVTISATTVSSGSARSATLSFNTQASVSASCSAVTSASNILSVSCTTSSPINSIQCSVDGEAPQSCTLPYTRDVSTLSAGSHQISVSFVAVNGATTSSSQAFTVSAVQSLSCSSSQTATQLTVSCSNAGDLTNLRCSLDGDTPSVCMLPYTRDISGLQTGKHTVTISATTVSSGSARSATLSFNTQASVSASCSAVTSASNILSVSCTTSSPINSIQCSVDGEAPQSCTLPYTRDVSTLSAGSHQISVSFVAVNGATTSSSQAFTVSAVQSLSCSSSQTATQLTVSCSNAGDLTNLRCSLDGDTPSVCMLPYTRDISGLQTGKHTVTISATTVSSGSARSATLPFNTQASVSASCSAVTSASNILSVSCTTSSPINSIQCSVDGEAPQSCTLPYTRDVSTLSAGSHQISVSFVAVNGATTSSSQAFTVSAVQSLSCSSSQTATQLTVSCSNAGDLTNLRCSVDGDTSSVCMLPYTRDISGLQTGKHTVTISATTVSSGSARSATLSFNTQASVSASCSAVASASNILSVSCTTSSPINSIQCSVDGEAPQSCTLPYTRDVSTLSVGSHQISVSFVAVNGATTSSTQAFTVSAVQSLSCSSSQTATQLTVSCSNAGDLTNLRCSLDGDTPSVCMLPYTRDISGLQTGKHTVTISATTVSSGSARSATLSFNTQASVSASCSAVTSASNILSVSCTTSSPINSIQCSVDGEAPQSCTLPYTRDVSTLSAGSHQISVSFVAVNGATTSSSQAFTVSAVQSLSCSSSQTATQLTVSCSNAGDLTNLRCSVDGDTSSVCMLPYTRDISGLQTGKHTVTISATTVSSGSARSATLSFNTQASVSASCSAVASASNILSVSCTTSSPINSIQCSVDGEAPQSCTLPYTRDVSTLSVGSHQISVSFVAVNGATTSSTQAFTVSAVQSLSCSSSQTATQLTVSCANAGDLTNLRCSLDGDTPSVCMLPYTRDISGLQTGKHTVTISATTVSSGSARSATLSFNTQASVSASCSAVASASNILSVSCTTSSPINSIQCSVDGEAPQSCTLPYTRDVSTLSVGSHQISVSFVAVNGATTSSTQAFTVSAVQSLSCSSSQTAAQLTVSCANAGDLTNLRCSLDGDTPSVCMLPYTRDISGLQTGKHTVIISATTVSSGSARSAILSFNTQAAPLVLKCSASVDSYNVLSVSCLPNNPVSRVSCEFDGTPSGSCYLSFTRDVSMLKVGTHNIKFTAFGFNDDFGSTTVTYDVKNALVLHCKSSVTNSVLTTSCSSNMQISSTTCSVDKEVPRACTIPYVRNISTFQAGEHTVTISATATNGIAGTSATGFTVQSALSLVCANEVDSAVLVVRCNSSSLVQSFLCALDGGPPIICTIPYVRDITALLPGKHTASIYAVDTRGSLAVWTKDFSISDIAARCSSTVNNLQLAVICSINIPNTAMMCSINNEPFQSCTLPYNRPVDFLPSGVHVVTVSISAINKIPTTVTVPFEIPTVDDLSGPLSVRFINNSPVVKDKTITVFVQANKQTDAIYCQAIGTTLGTVDCSNGVAIFNNVPAGDVVIKVTAQSPYEETVISSTITVPYMNSDCSVYLINDMITTVGDTVIVRFGSTGQPRGFLCSSDGYKKSCVSPYIIKNVKYGKHYIVINPEGCEGKSTWKGFYFYTYNN
ncbi:hypothetical protein EMCRGX_G011883 [Ephydatia muelleri]